MLKGKWCIVSVLPVMILMGLIFYFSSQEADESTETSTAVGRLVVEMQMEVSRTQLSADEIEARAIQIDGYIRKTAHMLEYAILAFCVLLPFMIYKIKSPLRYLLCFLFSVAYAASDEFHQTFVRGRFGCVKDVLIDSIGIIACVIITWILQCFTKSLQKKKRNLT